MTIPIVLPLDLLQSSLVIIEALILPIRVLVESSRLILFGLVFYFSVAITGSIIDFVYLVGTGKYRKSKMVSIKDRCLDQFPFDIVYNNILFKYNLIINGDYDKMFLSSNYFGLVKSLDLTLSNFSKKFKNCVSRKEFIVAVQEFMTLPKILFAKKYHVSTEVGVFAIFLPSLVDQYFDLSTVCELLSQSCRLSTIDEAQKFYQKLENVDELTRDIAQELDDLARYPCERPLIVPFPEFTWRMRSTLQKFTLPVIDRIIDWVKKMSADEMLGLVVTAYEVIRKRYHLRDFVSSPHETADLWISMCDTLLSKLNLDQVEKRYQRYFRDDETLNEVKNKLVEMLQLTKERCLENIEKYKPYDQVKTVKFPAVGWFGDGLFAITLDDTKVVLEHEGEGGVK